MTGVVRACRRTLVLVFLWLLASPAAAQQVRTAVVPAGITVGDVFQVVIRVTGAAGAQVVFPDSLVLPPELEAAARRELRQDSTGLTAVYAVTAWRPGTHALQPVEIQLDGADGTQTASAGIPDVIVRSVLPADTAGIEPKPAKDVLGENRIWWPWLLLALALLLLALTLIYLYRRARARRPVPVPVIAPEDARERALRELDATRASGALEAGDYKRFHTEVSDALRSYVGSFDARLGTELTSTELGFELVALGRADEAVSIRPLLHEADMVKFARRGSSTTAALEYWSAVRAWVERHPEPQPLERAA